ncbi:MAG: hypothetical protein N4A40_17210 [Tissierellales bacterium]|jgi:hypothetical protein|nr:hypothetical protein [Tissierellales bacterium]
MENSLHKFLLANESILLTDHPQKNYASKFIKKRFLIIISIWILGFLVMLLTTNQFGTYLFLTLPGITMFTLFSLLDLIHKSQRAKYVVYVLTDKRVLIRNKRLDSLESFYLDKIIKIDKISKTLDLWLNSNKKVRLSDLSKTNEFQQIISEKTNSNY